MRMQETTSYERYCSVETVEKTHQQNHRGRHQKIWKKKGRWKTPRKKSVSNSRVASIVIFSYVFLYFFVHKSSLFWRTLIYVWISSPPYRTKRIKQTSRTKPTLKRSPAQGIMSLWTHFEYVTQSCCISISSIVLLFVPNSRIHSCSSIGQQALINLEKHKEERRIF